MPTVAPVESASEANIVPADPRAVCNLILDDAGPNRPLTNMALQKLLYFAHGVHLIQTKRALVTGYFEAWQYGPVHPLAYMAFRDAGKMPIRFRAKKRDPFTGQLSELVNPADQSVLNCVRGVVLAYAGLSPSRLVQLSHAPEAPWRVTVDKARTSMAFGLRIADIVILDRFKYHKVSMQHLAASGEQIEDTPFA